MRQRGPAGTTAVKDHAWTTPGHSGDIQGEKAEWNPRVFGGTELRCHVQREIYTRVLLYTGDVATQCEARAISDQVTGPKIRLKLLN